MYLLFIYAFPYINLEKYYPPLSFSPWLLKGYGDSKSIMIQFIVLNGLAGILLLYKGMSQIKRRERDV